MQFNDNQPIWLQIYDYACRAIINRTWPEQERIPSVRELAVLLQVNPNTVMRAYDKLESEGLILTRRGMGFFVTEGARRRSSERLRGEFLRCDLPALFARMEELDIDLETLLRHYDLYKKHNDHENEQ